MMRTLRIVFVCVLMAAGTAFAQRGRASQQPSEDWKGTATLSGKVTDPEGKAVNGATVTLTLTSVKASVQTKTNSQGVWQAKNVADGVWDVKIEKKGFTTKEFEVEVGGEMKNPHVEVRMSPAASAAVNKELDEGDKKARALIAEKKYADARAIYEDLLAKYPQAVRIHTMIASTYDAEGDYAKAAESLKKYLDTDQNNTQLWGFYAVFNAKAGNADEALRVLAAEPPAAMKESVDLQECGFALLRAKKPADAVKFFDEAVKRFPNEAGNYFYRGLSEAQIGAQVEKPGSAESNAQIEKAKADLTKFLEMAPSAPEADQAKKILDSIK
jgi:tetratricopeptide (TPR) repeat protein